MQTSITDGIQKGFPDPLETMETMPQHTSTLSEILRTAPQLRSFWTHLGFDAFHHRDLSITEVCRKLDLDLSTVGRLLAATRAVSLNPPAVVVELLTLEELCEYIRGRQRHLLAEMSELNILTHRALAENGGERLSRIRSAFLTFRSKFETHLQEESWDLIPNFCLAPKHEERPNRVELRTRLARLACEHHQADEALAELSTLADDRSMHATQSSVTRTISTAISRLHQIVHEEIYTENRIFFPKALTS